MNITLILALILLVYPTNAYAFFTPSYTGNTAEAFDAPGNYHPGGSGSLGGPVANNRYGLAYQFLVDQDVQTTHLNVSADYGHGVGTTTIKYKLFTDSTYQYRGDIQTRPIPLVGALALVSQPLSFTNTQQEDNVGIRKNYAGQIPFEYSFVPGTYWLATDGVGGAFVKLDQTFGSVSSQLNKDFAPIHTPEPLSLLLMGGGLLAMARRQFKRREG